MAQPRRPPTQLLGQTVEVGEGRSVGGVVHVDAAVVEYGMVVAIVAVAVVEPRRHQTQPAAASSARHKVWSVGVRSSAVAEVAAGVARARSVLSRDRVASSVKHHRNSVWDVRRSFMSRCPITKISALNTF